MFTGKKLSILGDSISTYKGISNDETVHHDLFYNPYFYKDPFPLEKTYWSLILKNLGMTLCVNNSWSGGNLSGQDNPDAGVNRANALARDDGTRPDIIIVFMGINDFGRGVDVAVFSADYRKTLDVIQKQHPNAKVCCVNLPDRYPALKAQTELFNQEIDSAARAAGKNFFVADLFGSCLNNEFYYNNTVDSLHPDEDGMRYIAEVIQTAIEANVMF